MNFLVGNLFVCLGFSHAKIFVLYGDITITGEGLHILTYARHSWLLSSKGSLACHTYCDMGHPFLMVINLKTCDTLYDTFYDLGLSLLGFEHPTFRLHGKRFYTLRQNHFKPKILLQYEQNK